MMMVQRVRYDKPRRRETAQLAKGVHALSGSFIIIVTEDGEVRGGYVARPLSITDMMSTKRSRFMSFIMVMVRSVGAYQRL